MNNKLNKKEIGQLVKLYFDYNPQNNKGIGWRAKANDIITSYANIHGMTYQEIEHCITSQPMTKKAIWDQFSHYYNNMKKVEKTDSNYKNSVGDSTNPDEWI